MSRAQQLPTAGGYHTGWHRYRAFPSLQLVLLSVQHWSKLLKYPEMHKKNQLKKMCVQIMGHEGRDQWCTELVGTASEFVPVHCHTYSIFPKAIALPFRNSVALLPSLISVAKMNALLHACRQSSPLLIKWLFLKDINAQFKNYSVNNVSSFC